MHNPPDYKLDPPEPDSEEFQQEVFDRARAEIDEAIDQGTDPALSARWAAEIAEEVSAPDLVWALLNVQSSDPLLAAQALDTVTRVQNLRDQFIEREADAAYDSVARKLTAEAADDFEPEWEEA